MTHSIRFPIRFSDLWIKKLFLFLFCCLCKDTLLAQLQVQITTEAARCSADGRIIVNASGGTQPYTYVLVGSVRPPQNTNIFDLLPPANYTVRVTDNLGLTQTVNAVVAGNYQEPTILRNIVNLDTVQVIGNQGLMPYRYAISTNNGLTFSAPQTSNFFTCLPRGTHIVRMYDNCNNFYSLPVTIVVEPLVHTTLCEKVNGKTNLRTVSFSGGRPPYTFTCINNLGDTFRNATGNFSQMRGCSFNFTFADRCNQENVFYDCSDLKGYVKCVNFSNQTATIYGQGGNPPYRFYSLNNLDSNQTGIFTNLPSNLNTYYFSIKDACGKTERVQASQMKGLPNDGNTCPFLGNMRVSVDQLVSLPDTCGKGCSMFYPYRFQCLDCVPARTLSDSGAQYVRARTFQADFSTQLRGIYHLQVVNGCQDTVRFSVEVKPDETPLGVVYDCITNTIRASSFNNVTYFLKDTTGRLLATNRTGIFNAPRLGVFYVYAIYPGCDTVRRYVEVGAAANLYCLSMSSQLNPVTGVCDFKWKLNSISPSATFRIRGLNDTINVSNNTGIFNNLAPNSRYLFTTDCKTDTVNTPLANNPSLRADLLANCAGLPAIQAFGGRDETVCQSRYRDKYFLYDEQGNLLKSNFTGLFDSLATGKWYEVRLQNPEGCFVGSVRRQAEAYIRPDLWATYGVVCAAGQTTGSIRVTTNGGAPPYTFEMTSPVGLRTPIVTYSNSTVYNNLPIGNYTFRVMDACGISSDFATSVGTLQLTPTSKRLCDGTLILSIPIIDNATYRWTNNAGTVLGNNRILEIRDTIAQTYAVEINTPQPCSYTNRISIPSFSPVNITANAGIDFVSNNATTTLRAQPLQANTVGRWFSINPSSGATTFGNVNNPNTTITVSRVPGEYLYVWEVQHPAGGCILTDTVRGIFCSTISPLTVTIATTPTACKTPTGKAVITVQNATALVTYRWSNGKTTATVNNLSAGRYTVTIQDGLPCTQIRVDTVIITNPTATLPRLIDTTACGVSLRIGDKNYTQNGRYQDTVRTILGCDSLIVIGVKLNRVPIDSLGIVHQLKAMYCADSISLNGKGDSTNKYQWFWQNVPCPTCPNPHIVPLSSRAYTVMITDRITKCVGRDTVNVLVEGAFMERIPNVFTPNGDGLNEIFNVLPDNCIKTVRRLRIYSRSGNLVFDKTDVSPHRKEGWDGAIDNKDHKHELPSDAYVFIIEIELNDGTLKQTSGEIVLLR